jgi:hypothetical protein
MKILIALIIIIIVILFLIWLGIRIPPKPFPAYPERTPELKTVPLPDGLPAPVERFYRQIYGDKVPVIDTVVIVGRAVMRPAFNISLPARFVFVHNAGKDYRHYIEATIYGLPFLKINEGYVDGKSFFESPMGSYYDDPNTNQGANLALWAETGWFPSIMATDPRVHWEPIDDNSALLFIPFEDQEENFVVRFNPDTGLMDSMEAMRYRESGEGGTKILWITRTIEGKKIKGTNISAIGSATWLDQGTPWAVFALEDVVYNVDVSEYIRRRGP